MRKTEIYRKGLLFPPEYGTPPLSEENIIIVLSIIPVFFNVSTTLPTLSSTPTTRPQNNRRILNLNLIQQNLTAVHQFTFHR